MGGIHVVKNRGLEILLFSVLIVLPHKLSVGNQLRNFLFWFAITCIICIIRGGGGGESLLHVTSCTERQWLLRKLFSLKESYKKVAWIVLWSNSFNRNLTSLWYEGTCATRPSHLCFPEKCVKTLRKWNDEAVFSLDGNHPIIFS